MKSFDNDFFRKKHWLCLLLLLIPFFLYRKALTFDFSPMDEQWMIEDNGWFLAHWSNIKTIFSNPTALQVYYRPLFVMTTMLDFHIGKLEPFIYHLSTLLWHLGCVLLVFEFLLQYKTDNRIAFFMALIFAVHPVMLHTVAWIPGRNDSMLCFFMLASVISLNNYIDSKKKRFFLFHILFFLFALLTKETAVVFPLIYFVILYLKQKDNNKLLWSCAVLWLILDLGWLKIWSVFVGEVNIPDGKFIDTSQNTAAALFLYLGKILFPFQQSVFPVLKHTSVIPGIFTLLIFSVLWWRFKPEDKKTALFGCFLFFIVLIVPVVFSAMKSNGEQYEHRLYAPMTGVFLFLSKLRFQAKPSVFTFIFMGLAGFLMLVTNKRMDVYKNKLSFLNAGISSYPEYYYFYLEKGQLLDKQGDFEKAIQSFDEAIARNPRHGQTYFFRGNAYISLGDKKHSIADYTSALALSEGKTKDVTLLQRCFAYNIFNEPELAMKDLQTLKIRCPQLITPDFEKEVTTKMEIEKWNIKVQESPRNAEVYLMRGMFFTEQRMAKEAIADFKKATELAPGNREYMEFFRRASAELAPALEKMQ